MNKYSFHRYVESRDTIVLDPFVLEHLTLEEMEALNVLNELLGNNLTWGGLGQAGKNLVDPRKWAQWGGQAVRGISNLPTHAKAAYHGIDPNDPQYAATGGINSPEFQRALAGKQHGLDPSAYNNVGGAFDQNKWDTDLAAAKYNAMSPEDKKKHWQSKQYDAEQQANLSGIQHTTAMNQINYGTEQQRRQNQLQSAQQKASQQQQAQKDPNYKIKQAIPALQKLAQGKSKLSKSLAQVLPDLEKAFP